MEFTNTLHSIDTTPHCFVEDKKALVDYLMQTTQWRAEFKQYNKQSELKQTGFNDPHLHGFDIAKLLFFFNNKLDELVLQVGTEEEQEQIRGLINILPPIKEKPQNVWYIFKTEVKTNRPQFLTNNEIAKDLKKEIEIELEDFCEGSKMFPNICS